MVNPGADLSPLRAVPGVESVTQEGIGHRIDLIAGADPVSTLRAIALAVPPVRIELQRPSLEDAFIALTSDDAVSTGASK